jgi:SH3-like domain-containing protein
MFRALVLSTLLFLLTLSTAQAPAVAQGGPPVLAFYYAWFDQNTWGSGQPADQPATLYTSADRATIERHVSEAQSAGIDAFVQSWYGPQEANNQTETNFRMLLDVAQTRGFQAAVDVEVGSPFFGGIGDVQSALSTLLATHIHHPAYLRYQGRPVIFFWRQQNYTVGQWAAIRNQPQIDPDHTTAWIAEGTDLSYQAVFDGHHLYSIAWAGSPAAELAKWSGRMQEYEANNGVDRLWAATVMPGYDDTKLSRANSFAVPRRDGAYYRETWQGAVASAPDLIIITSYNEWLEGTQLEPSATYGNLYLDVTRELVTTMRGNPPPAPPPVPVAPLATTEPSPAQIAAAGEEPPLEEPFTVEDLTNLTITPTQRPTPSPPTVTMLADEVNVRRGPGRDFETLGRLDEGATAPVVAKSSDDAWWQIEFEAEGNESGLGWIAAEFANFSGNAKAIPVATSPPTITPTPTPIIAGIIRADDAINVRAEPSLDAESVGGMYLGDTANVLGISADGNWWQIEFPDGPEGVGWVTIEFVTFEGDKELAPIFTSLTPTPSATTAVSATPKIILPSEQPTFAPTATSLYQATAAALLDNRTPEPPPAVSAPPPQDGTVLPWGILSLVVIAGFLWYQFSRSKQKDKGVKTDEVQE